MSKDSKQTNPVYTASEEDTIIRKAKLLIEQSITKEQLKTARKFIDLFIRDDADKNHIREELVELWLERDRFLFQG
jgi:hypothetical protein